MENGLAKGLDLPDDVPRFIVGDALHDVFQKPLQNDICRMKVLDKLIYGQFLYLIVVEADSQVCRQIQFTCEITEYPLEEGVDGFNTEVIVIV